MSVMPPRLPRVPDHLPTARKMAMQEFDRAETLRVELERTQEELSSARAWARALAAALHFAERKQERDEEKEYRRSLRAVV
jgi:hypothetical protein